MDRFASIQAFVAVVEESGFAAAGRKLKMSRSQASKLVLALENHLQTQLLYRSTKSVTPTAAGKAFFERAQTILDDLHEAERELQDDQDEPQGLIRVNTPMSFGTMYLGPAIADFIQLYPKLRVELYLTDRFIDPVTEGYDITVRVAEKAEDLNLICRTIAKARRVLVGSPHLIERVGAPQTPGDLANLPCLEYGNLPRGPSWKLIGPEGVTEVRVNSVLSVNNGEVLRDAALKDNGFALLPMFIVSEQITSGKLVTVLDEYTAPEIYVTLLYPPNRYLSPRIRSFVEFLYQRFEGNVDWNA
ncbi:MAG: LysR family transcriptional regulator [Pseudomonadota bacterium]